VNEIRKVTIAKDRRSVMVECFETRSGRTELYTVRLPTDEEQIALGDAYYAGVGQEQKGLRGSLRTMFSRPMAFDESGVMSMDSTITTAALRAFLTETVQQEENDG
jgi:hypothetical protein